MTTVAKISAVTTAGLMKEVSVLIAMSLVAMAVATVQNLAQNVWKSTVANAPISSRPKVGGPSAKVVSPGG